MADRCVVPPSCYNQVTNILIRLGRTILTLVQVGKQGKNLLWMGSSCSSDIQTNLRAPKNPSRGISCLSLCPYGIKTPIIDCFCTFPPPQCGAVQPVLIIAGQFSPDWDNFLHISGLNTNVGISNLISQHTASWNQLEHPPKILIDV